MAEGQKGRWVVGREGQVGVHLGCGWNGKGLGAFSYIAFSSQCVTFIIH